MTSGQKGFRNEVIHGRCVQDGKNLTTRHEARVLLRETRARSVGGFLNPTTRKHKMCAEGTGIDDLTGNTGGEGLEY